MGAAAAISGAIDLHFYRNFAQLIDALEDILFATESK
jgi:hypothetical protein